MTIEIHHVVLAIAASAAFGAILGAVLTKIATEKEIKTFWNNPRERDEFMNVPPRTSVKKWTPKINDSKN